jgi:hypothetical protein
MTSRGNARCRNSTRFELFNQRSSASSQPIAEGPRGYSPTVARLDDYSFGRVTVDGSEQRGDLIVLPDRVVTSWWRRHGHSLAMEDLDEVLDELPERLILGTGAYGRLHPDPRVIVALERRGVAVECLQTDDAVRRYGELDERRTAAALHLTC